MHKRPPKLNPIAGIIAMELSSDLLCLVAFVGGNVTVFSQTSKQFYLLLKNKGKLDVPMEIARIVGISAVAEGFSKEILDDFPSDVLVGIWTGLEFSGIASACAQFSDVEETRMMIEIGAALMVGRSCERTPRDILRSIGVVNPAFRGFISEYRKWSVLRGDGFDLAMEKIGGNTEVGASALAASGIALEIMLKDREKRIEKLRGVENFAVAELTGAKHWRVTGCWGGDFGTVGQKCFSAEDCRKHAATIVAVWRRYSCEPSTAKKRKTIPLSFSV